MILSDLELFAGQLGHAVLIRDLRQREWEQWAKYIGAKDTLMVVEYTLAVENER